jgi:uncharacterized protein (DUF488 family)
MLNRIYTIGHSTRDMLEFVRLLREHGITRLADIRRFPGSRRFPHFSAEAMEKTLTKIGIEYLHFEELGGRRKPRKDSENAAWESDQFRGYADHMGTPQFHQAVDRLLETERPTAYMCAEAVPWRCHRNLLSDELVRRRVEVLHILGPGQLQPHTLSDMARLESGRVTYPAPQVTLFPKRRV